MFQHGELHDLQGPRLKAGATTEEAGMAEGDICTVVEHPEQRDGVPEEWAEWAGAIGLRADARRRGAEEEDEEEEFEEGGAEDEEPGEEEEVEEEFDEEFDDDEDLDDDFDEEFEEEDEEA